MKCITLTGRLAVPLPFDVFKQYYLVTDLEWQYAYENAQVDVTHCQRHLWLHTPECFVVATVKDDKVLALYKIKEEVLYAN